jgi:hypothetical protein
MCGFGASFNHSGGVRADVRGWCMDGAWAHKPRNTGVQHSGRPLVDTCGLRRHPGSGWRPLSVLAMASAGSCKGSPHCPLLSAAPQASPPWALRNTRSQRAWARASLPATPWAADRALRCHTRRMQRPQRRPRRPVAAPPSGGALWRRACGYRSTRMMHTHACRLRCTAAGSRCSSVGTIATGPRCLWRDTRDSLRRCRSPWSADTSRTR